MAIVVLIKDKESEKRMGEEKGRKRKKSAFFRLSLK